MSEKPATDLGVLVTKYIQLLVMLVALAIAYQKLRGDLDVALVEVRRLVHVIEEQQRSVNDVRIKQERMEQNVDDFRLTYEKDFNRYIRETPKR